MAVGPGCFFTKFITPAGLFLAPPQYSRDTNAKPMPVLGGFRGSYLIEISVRFFKKFA